MTLSLPSGVHERYLLVAPVVRDAQHNPLADAVATVAVLIAQEQAPPPSLADEALRALLDRAQRRTEPALVRELVLAFNVRADAARAAGAWAAPAQGPLSAALTAHLWRQAYERLVDDPESLNKYQSFSKEVYGETCAPLMTEVMAKASVKRRQLFVDFGMGIGNVVFQAAAQAHCNVFGIELMETPFAYAQRLLAELQLRVASWRRTMGSVRLFRGDFLQLPEVAAIVNAIDVAFVQNYAFDAQTNDGLMQLFISLKEGARAVTFKSLAPHKNRVTEHNVDAPSAIFRVTKHTYLGTDGVSWAAMQIDYYVHVVDRARLRAMRAAAVAKDAVAKPRARVRDSDSDSDREDNGRNRRSRHEPA